MKAFGDGEVEQPCSSAKEEDGEDEDYFELGGLIIISPQHSYYNGGGVSIQTNSLKVESCRVYDISESLLIQQYKCTYPILSYLLTVDLNDSILI